MGYFERFRKLSASNQVTWANDTSLQSLSLIGRFQYDSILLFNTQNLKELSLKGAYSGILTRIEAPMLESVHFHEVREVEDVWGERNKLNANKLFANMPNITKMNAIFCSEDLIQ